MILSTMSAFLGTPDSLMDSRCELTSSELKTDVLRHCSLWRLTSCLPDRLRVPYSCSRRARELCLQKDRYYATEGTGISSFATLFCLLRLCLLNICFYFVIAATSPSLQPNTINISSVQSWHRCLLSKETYACASITPLTTSNDNSSNNNATVCYMP